MRAGHFASRREPAIESFVARANNKSMHLPSALRRALILLLHLQALVDVCLAETAIGLVDDGPRSRPSVPLDVLNAEIASLVGDEFQIVMPEDKRLDGGWTLAGSQAAIARRLADPDVDLSGESVLVLKMATRMTLKSATTID